MSELKVNTINPSSGTSLQFPAATQVVVGNTGDSTVLVVSSATAENLGALNGDYHLYTTDGVVKSVYGWKSNSVSEALGTVSAHPLNLITNNTARMTIAGGGDITLNNSTLIFDKPSFGNSNAVTIPGINFVTNPTWNAWARGIQWSLGNAATADGAGIGVYGISGLTANRISIGFNPSPWDETANSLHVTQNGSVGIGVASPLAKLDVTAKPVAKSYSSSVLDFSSIHLNGSWANPTNNAITFSSGGGGGAAINFRRDGSYGTYIDFYTNPNTNSTRYAAANRMSIRDDGNVGIGTTGPSQKLHVFGSGAMVRIDNTNYANGDISLISTGGPAGGGSNLQIIHQTGNVLAMKNSGSLGGGFAFQGSGLTSMVIDSAGNVGVGTASPAVPLDVVGVTKSTSFVGNGIIPIGGIIMWYGTIANIPSGWALCNGQNNTPDLRDKFIVGATADSSGAAKTNITASLTQTGGTKDSIVVDHTHTATSAVSDPGHTHTYITKASTANQSGSSTACWTSTANATTTSSQTGITVGTTINNAGSTGTNANLPPYYALAFIMRTA